MNCLSHFDSISYKTSHAPLRSPPSVRGLTIFGVYVYNHIYKSFRLRRVTSRQSTYLGATSFAGYCPTFAHRHTGLVS